MGIYKQARKLALGVACASGLVAGVGMVAAPGSALAAMVPCEKIEASGSSLQAEQQTMWTGLVKAATFKLMVGAEECNPGNPVITYTSTSSGEGLEVFGMPSKTVKKRGALVLDGFIGTDDPPTAALLTNAEEASEKGAGAKTKATTVPVVAAPIAVIANAPASGCTINGTEGKKAEAIIPDTVLSELWLSKYTKWSEFLTAAKIEFTGACSTAIKLEVRSDTSGTSYAFKQYLCQTNLTAWGNGEECESGLGFVTDAATWPNEPGEIHKTHGAGVENKGSGGEVAAVEAEEGSFGYVNLANAALATTKFTPWTGPSGRLYWFKVQNESDPEASKKGNCTKTFVLGAQQTAAEKGEWAKVHLAKKGQAGAYPICTFTYDVGWANYKTAELEKAENYNAKGTAIGNTAKGYFEYMTSTTKGQAAASIKEYYAPLPAGAESVQEIAAALSKTKIG